MPRYGVKYLKLGFSDINKKHPDIWLRYEDMPVIIVTREWLRQNTHERRKRLVHEMEHIRGLEHGRIGKYNFSTYPDKDTWSKFVYNGIIK